MKAILDNCNHLTNAMMANGVGGEWQEVLFYHLNYTSLHALQCCTPVFSEHQSSSSSVEIVCLPIIIYNLFDTFCSVSNNKNYITCSSTF